MDALALLRKAISDKQPIQYEAEEKMLVFQNGARHSADAPTPYHANRGQSDPYTLGTIWFYVTNSGLGLAGPRLLAHAPGLGALPHPLTRSNGHVQNTVSRPVPRGSRSSTVSTKRICWHTRTGRSSRPMRSRRG